MSGRTQLVVGAVTNAGSSGVARRPRFTYEVGLDPRHVRDLELVGRALERAPEAIEQLGERLRCVARIVASRNAVLRQPLRQEDLADLIQDCLALIWRKLRTFEGRASLETWVYRICTLELMNGVRRVRRDKGSRLSVVEEMVTDERADPANHTALQDLHSGLAELDPLDGEIMRLKHFEDLTFVEIGLRLSVTTSKAKARYYRGLRQLESFLRPSWGEGQS